ATVTCPAGRSPAETGPAEEATEVAKAVEKATAATGPARAMRIPTPTDSPRWLFDAHARDRPADNQLLDLLGALEDVVDLGVAMEPLDGVLAHIAVSTEDLDRPFGDPHG